MPKIIKDYVSKSQKKQRPGYAMSPKYITVHNTANANKGANAEMHARYLHNGAGGRSVGWHFTVDDTQIIQHLPTNESGRSEERRVGKRGRTRRRLQRV